MADLDKLEAAARAATPGPWSEFCESSDWWLGQVEPDGAPGETVCETNTWGSQEDIDFVALANPATILELIVRLKTAMRNADGWERRARELESIAADRL